MNCYECKHRGSVTGSAHSSCKAINNHDALKDLTEHQRRIVEMATVTSGKFPLEFEDGRQLISFDTHGQKNGWCMWPVNFDPIWVRECIFHEPKTIFETIEKIAK